MTEHHFPGYDVLAKRNGMSWNDVTRRVIDARLAMGREPKFFSYGEWRTLDALCARILPQPKDRPPVPLAACIDQKMFTYGERGTRIAPMPWDGAAWKIALHALEAEAQDGYGRAFHELPAGNSDALLHRMQKGELKNAAWGDVSPEIFFAKRILTDIPAAYYAHPTAWSEIGFGGPASPRGYVRMEANRRDPWEAAEAKPGRTEPARLANRHVR